MNSEHFSVFQCFCNVVNIIFYLEIEFRIAELLELKCIYKKKLFFYFLGVGQIECNLDLDFVDKNFFWVFLVGLDVFHGF